LRFPPVPGLTGKERNGSTSPVRRAAGEGPLFARRTAGVDVRPAALCNLHDVIN
jgi:hypothetical protein